MDLVGLGDLSLWPLGESCGLWLDLSFPGDDDLDWGPGMGDLGGTGGDYVGPGSGPATPRRGVVYEGRPILALEIDNDIGPEFYNFCEVRYIGEPVLRHVTLPRVQNVTYINNTVNVTDITVRNNVVYNYGPSR